MTGGNSAPLSVLFPLYTDSRFLCVGVLNLKTPATASHALLLRAPATPGTPPPLSFPTYSRLDRTICFLSRSLSCPLSERFSIVSCLRSLSLSCSALCTASLPLKIDCILCPSPVSLGPCIPSSPSSLSFPLPSYLPNFCRTLMPLWLTALGCGVD